MEDTNVKKKRKVFKMPHIYVLLVLLICISAIGTWLLPAGQFERQENEAGVMLVVPGTYEVVDSSPVGPFQMIRAIYKGMIDAGAIVFFVFISYASISLIIETGAFNGLIAGLLKVLKGKYRAVIIPIFIAVIGLASSTIGVFEEAFPFVPIFVGAAIAMGYDAIVGVAIVALGTGLGYSGATMNPFTVGMAQSIAELPQLSGVGYRIFCHIVFIIVASIFVVRYALKIQSNPEKSVVYGDDFSHVTMNQEELENHPFGFKEKMVLFTLLAGIAVIVYGCKYYGWYFEELCAVFLIMGIVSSIIMGWGPNTIANKMAKSFADIATACLMIGLARGILVVLTEGKIIDTIVYGLSIPLSKLPRWLAAEAMLIVQTIISFIIPSGSGQAATSMPIMVPLSDLLHIPRQVSVLAYQFADGLTNVLWPTASTPIICGIAGVKIEKWWKFFVPIFGILFLVEGILVALALAIGWA